MIYATRLSGLGLMIYYSTTGVRADDDTLSCYTFRAVCHLAIPIAIFTREIPLFLRLVADDQHVVSFPLDIGALWSRLVNTTIY